MNRKPFISTRTFSETSPLNPSIAPRQNVARTSSYGSFIPYLEFLRNTLTRNNSSSQGLNRCESMGSIGHRALLQFLDAEDLNGLRVYLDSRQSQVDDRDENGTSILLVAAARGLIQFVKELVARNADVQAQDLDSWTALLCAAKGGHCEVIQYLLDHGAAIEHRDMGGWTALMWCSYRGHRDAVALLLERGADVQAHGNFLLGPLLWAAGRGFTDIVQMLVNRGAKVNVGDKYGTTALVWACRKGNADIVDILLKAGANVDTAGMYSWTPLLVAVSGGHHDCVALLLEKKPNVNALDKDGMTALSLSCREGLQEIASALIAAGAYVNVQDRAGDTPLIYAVKGGHRGVVEALLKRHADVDIQGKDRKSALYTAAEKGHVHIVKILLASNPDMELATKDGDTALLRGVRNRNLEIVQMLLDKKAKVGAVDRRGDTCLHIAMRARSKAIVEALLRNPKNSQLLYRGNKAGETPYAIDNLHSKTILGQVFGARRLNANEDSEGMLGYELYSSALADVLSEPTLKTPITVGLYAKWGSGKSFLLNKLCNEMKSFECHIVDPVVKTPWLHLVIFFHVALVAGLSVALATYSYIWGLSTGVTVLVVFYTILWLIKYMNRRYDNDWAAGLSKQLGRLRLIVQVAFCHPPGPQNSSQPMSVHFHFAETNSAAPTGESAIEHMLASLFDAIEKHYGSLPTRLYRAFRPRPVDENSGWRWRRMCCLPLILLFEMGVLGLIAGVSLLILYFGYHVKNVNNEGIIVTLYVLGAFLLAGCLANLHAWSKAIRSLIFSQGKQLKRAVRGNEGSILTNLGTEVALMADMVKCLDAFTGQQSRLVGVVDALDSCDTERTLTVLNAIQTLLSSPNRPFILLLSVDPHVIAKAAEANSRRLFTEGGIGGHDFLRNLVHLPIYLQNSGLRKIQRAQSTAHNTFKRTITDYSGDEYGLGHSASSRRLSNASEIMSSQEKLRAPPSTSRSGSKKLRLSESVASSIGSNIHKLGQNAPMDLSRMVLTDDYFSDVNPRSMRRLMNVIYITVRLLKAFQIEFSWYRLTSWINLTEQWPLRASMIVLEHDQCSDSLDDTFSLQSVYEKVRPKLSCLREAANLLDLDRDERKLDAFLQLHKSDLLVADLKIFLPFTINLDPYLRKVLKEDQQAIEDEGIVIPVKSVTPHSRPTVQTVYPNLPQMQFSQMYGQTPAISMMNYYNTNPQSPVDLLPPPPRKKSITNLNSDYPNETGNLQLLQQHIKLDMDLSQIRLSKLNTTDLINILSNVDDLKPALEKLGPILQENAISGRVLMHCDLAELKNVLCLNFGNWEIFKLLITSLKSLDRAKPVVTFNNNISSTNNPVSTNNHHQKGDVKETIEGHQIIHTTRPKPQSVMEKQVTLEEQMICGALQTLNEDAFEDVLGSERPSPTVSSTASPVFPKRDSILKRSGSIKSDKRVLIRNNSGFTIEHVNEKLNQIQKGRPSSLILSKGEKSNYKLTRSDSIDESSEDNLNQRNFNE